MKGEVPVFNALERLSYTDPSKRDELLQVAECERDLLARMQVTSTYLLFNRTPEETHTGKEQLRK